MSALGDYVHYTAVGYENFGINRPNGTGRTDYDPAYTTAFQRLKARAAEHALNRRVQTGQAIKEKMNDVLYNTDDADVAFNSDAMLEAMTQVLNQRFEQNINSVVGTNLAVMPMNQEMKELSKQIKNIQKSISTLRQQDDIDIQALLQQCQTIASVLTPPSNPASENVWNTWVSSLQTSIQDITNQLNGVITRLTGLSSSSSTVSPRNRSVSALWRIIRTLNTWPNLALQNGDIFEFLCTLVDVDAKQVADDEIKQYLLGQGSSKIIGDQFTTLDNAGYKVLVSNQSTPRPRLQVLDEDDTQVWIDPQVRNKTDVVIKFDIHGLDSTPLNLSLKNYSHLSQISVVKNTPLTNVLASTKPMLNDDYAFATHYLNLIAKHYNAPDPSAPEASISDSVTYLARMNKLMTGILIEIGLLGYDQNNQPEFFVINDQSHSRITVYSMQALLALIQDNILSPNDDTPSGIVIDGLPQNPSSIKQTYVLGDDGVNARITNFLYDVQEKHAINVHIQQSVLQQYMERYQLTP